MAITPGRYQDAGKAYPGGKPIWEGTPELVPVEEAAGEAAPRREIVEVDEEDGTADVEAWMTEGGVFKVDQGRVVATDENILR